MHSLYYVHFLIIRDCVYSIRSNTNMFKANKNLGLYYELELLVDYIEDVEDLTLLDELLVDFRTVGLTHHDLGLAIELIEEYLPPYFECDTKGCYFSQTINNIPALTYFSDIDVEQISSIKSLVLI